MPAQRHPMYQKRLGEWTKADWARWERNKRLLNCLHHCLMNIHSEVCAVVEAIGEGTALTDALGDRHANVTHALTTVVGELADAIFDAYEPSVPEFIQELAHGQAEEETGTGPGSGRGEPGPAPVVRPSGRNRRGRPKD